MIRLFLYLFLAISPAAADPEPGSAAERKPAAGWSMTPDPDLPDVLILGDSISIGYTLGVRSLLAGKANVFRPLAPNGKAPVNCAGTTAGLAGIDKWLAGRKWKIIHFNWGLHDMKHVNDRGQNSNNPDDPVQASIQQYAENLGKIVARLEATGAKLVFATTTPVAPGTSRPLRDPAAPDRYNSVALEIMNSRGIRVNDLHGFCKPRLPDLQLPKDVHFSRDGSQALAEQVAAAIEREL